MTIRRARRSDLPALSRLSRSLFEKYNDPDFPVTEASCAEAFETFARMPYFRVMERGDAVVGWLAAGEGAGMFHSSTKALSQLYYHSELSGLSAARALVEFHENLFLFAESRGYEVVVTSSVLPSSETFSRLLERAGWTRGERRLTRRTRWHPLAKAGAARAAPRCEGAGSASRRSPGLSARGADLRTREEADAG